MRTYREYKYICEAAGDPQESDLKTRIINELAQVINHLSQLKPISKWFGGPSQSMEIPRNTVQGIIAVINSIIPQINQLEEEEEVPDGLEDWLNAWKTSYGSRSLRSPNRQQPTVEPNTPEQPTVEPNTPEQPEQPTVEPNTPEQPEQPTVEPNTPEQPANRDASQPNTNSTGLDPRDLEQRPSGFDPDEVTPDPVAEVPDKLEPGTEEYYFVMGQARRAAAQHFGVASIKDVTIDMVYKYFQELEERGENSWQPLLANINKVPEDFKNKVVERGKALVKAMTGNIPGTENTPTIVDYVKEGNVRKINGQIKNTKRFESLNGEVMKALKDEDEDAFLKAYEEVKPKRGRNWGKVSLKRLVERFFEIKNDTMESTKNKIYKLKMGLRDRKILVETNKLKKLPIEERVNFLKDKLIR